MENKDLIKNDRISSILNGYYSPANGCEQFVRKIFNLWKLNANRLPLIEVWKWARLLLDRATAKLKSF